MSDAYAVALMLTLTVICHVGIVWRVTMIAHDPFVAGCARQGLRVSLVLIGFAVLMMAKFHIETGRGPWLPELMLLTGIDLYLGLIIWSNYKRLHRWGIKLRYQESRR